MIASSRPTTSSHGTDAVAASAFIRPTWMWRPRRRRLRIAAVAVDVEPTASTVTWAPPEVASRTRDAGSASSAPTVTSAPSSRPRVRAASDGSTATTRAPSATAIMIVDNPTPPQP